MKKLLVFVLLIVLVGSIYKGVMTFSSQPKVSQIALKSLTLLSEPSQNILPEPKLLSKRPDGFRVLAIAEYAYSPFASIIAPCIYVESVNDVEKSKVKDETIILLTTVVVP